ncbi:MAG: hypothetical protein GTN36_06530 [Candidatus Aenigmarchaeota archaeon]|nr:hypothetical protein [Candidatus Aenigmarchaeota archaeon]
MLFNLSILSVTLTLHESGHLYVGYLSGCNGRIILIDLENTKTYTEVKCNMPVNEVILSLGCFLFVIPFAILFLLLNMPEKNFFYVILGLGLSTSSLDILGILNNDVVFYTLVTLGTFLVIYGEALLINDRVFMTKEILVKL